MQRRKIHVAMLFAALAFLVGCGKRGVPEEDLAVPPPSRASWVFESASQGTRSGTLEFAELRNPSFATNFMTNFVGESGPITLTIPVADAGVSTIEGYYLNGKDHGPCRNWMSNPDDPANRILVREEYYSHGVKHGTSRWWHVDPYILSRQEIWSNGFAIGKQEYWDTRGTKVYEEDHRADGTTIGTFWNNSGDMLAKGTFTTNGEGWSGTFLANWQPLIYPDSPHITGNSGDFIKITLSNGTEVARETIQLHNK